VAERRGFQQEGRLRSHLLFADTGRRRDSLIWSLLPDELVSDGD
jgi:RimJ/RimL family protein N-acetyltransferase